MREDRPCLLSRDNCNISNSSPQHSWRNPDQILQQASCRGTEEKSEIESVRIFPQDWRRHNNGTAVWWTQTFRMYNRDTKVNDFLNFTLIYATFLWWLMFWKYIQGEVIHLLYILNHIPYNSYKNIVHACFSVNNLKFLDKSLQACWKAPD